MASRRIRAALLRLSPPWRRRHPVVLGGPGVTEASRLQWQLTFRERRRLDAASTTPDYYAAERDPTDEAGA